MVHRQTLMDYVPLLRRYARALRGSQALGDEAVRDCLAALASNPQGFPSRLDLYKVFHAVAGKPASTAERTAGMDVKVGRIPVEARQVLLLTALEGFSLNEAAEILGIEANAASRLLDSCLVDITRQRSMRVLIIEDEPIISLDLVNIMRTMGHEVVDVGSTHRGAVQAARLLRPELVLADINLADGSSGVDAVREILSETQIPIVFVTAFPEKLLTGQAPEPTYLVTKPFVPDAIRAAVSQALWEHPR